VQPIIIILHICVCVALILIVLLQKGKGAGMGAAFGGSSQTVFGSAGSSSFMQKVTTIVAVLFMLTCFGLSFFSGKGPSSSIMEDVSQPAAPMAETAEVPPQTGETEIPEGQP
jgi:preprotein translocase subunit SecG